MLAEGEVVSRGPVRRVVAESPAFAPQVTKVLGPPWLRVDEVGRRRAVSAAVSSGPAPSPLVAAVGRSCSAWRPSAGLMMLCLAAAAAGAGRRRRVDPPFLFLALLPLVIAVVLAEISEGGMDARVLAILGVLSAVNAVLRGALGRHWPASSWCSSC